MLAMLVTLAVFHEPMFWLKAAAPWNMDVMLVMFAVFQLLMLEGPFRLVHPLNMLVMSVTTLRLGRSVAVILRLLQP